MAWDSNLLADAPATSPTLRAGTAWEEWARQYGFTSPSDVPLLAFGAHGPDKDHADFAYIGPSSSALWLKIVPGRIYVMDGAGAVIWDSAVGNLIIDAPNVGPAIRTGADWAEWARQFGYTNPSNTPLVGFGAHGLDEDSADFAYVGPASNTPWLKIMPGQTQVQDGAGTVIWDSKIGCIRAQVIETGHTTAVGPTNIRAGGVVLPAGGYRVTCYGICTSAFTSGSIVVNLLWTDAGGARTDGVLDLISGNTTQVSRWVEAVRLDGTHDLQYQSVFNGVTGSPGYSFWLTVERID